MKLPYNKNIFIPNEKLTKYVLSETHELGKFKAKYFRKLGLDETNISLFEKTLRRLAQDQEITEEMSSVYGTKYVIEGKIETPIGKKIKVRTVWILEKGQKRPRFVTVYPV